MRYIFIFIIGINILLFNNSVLFGQNKPIFTLYLIGDAGLTASDDNPVGILSQELKNNSDQKNTAVVFLGDNIYPFGWREKGNTVKTASQFRTDSLIIDSQIKLFNGYKGHIYFVPGNHDWEKGKKGGYEVVKHEQKQIDLLLAEHSVRGGFYPKAGNPGPKIIRFNEQKIALVMFDSQWFLHKAVNKNVGGNEEKRELLFRSEMIDSLLQLKEQGFRIVINAHHPLYSIGLHGKRGFLLLRLLRRWNSQNIPTKSFSKYADLFKSIIKDSGMDNYSNLIMAFGHDHNLQYWGGDKSYHYILSGSGAKATDYVPKKKMSGKEGDDSFVLKYPKIESKEPGKMGYFKIEYFENNFEIHVLDISKESKQLFPSKNIQD